MRTLHPIELQALQLLKSMGDRDEFLPMFYRGACERLSLQGYVRITYAVPHPVTGTLVDKFELTPSGELVLRLHLADAIVGALGRAS